VHDPDRAASPFFFSFSFGLPLQQSPLPLRLVRSHSLFFPFSPLDTKLTLSVIFALNQSFHGCKSTVSRCLSPLTCSPIRIFPIPFFRSIYIFPQFPPSYATFLHPSPSLNLSCFYRSPWFFFYFFFFLLRVSVAPFPLPRSLSLVKRQISSQ